MEVNWIIRLFVLATGLHSLKLLATARALLIRADLFPHLVQISMMVVLVDGKSIHLVHSKGRGVLILVIASVGILSML